MGVMLTIATGEVIVDATVVRTCCGLKAPITYSIEYDSEVRDAAGHEVGHGPSV
jgi:hypothetical protein